MGKWVLIVVGIIAVLIGVIGFSATSAAVGISAVGGDVLDIAGSRDAIVEQARVVCSEGETLVDEEVTEGIRFYCVDGQGTRREVTRQVAELIGREVGRAVASPATNPIGYLFLGAAGVGVLLILAGFAMMMRGRGSGRTITIGG